MDKPHLKERRKAIRIEVLNPGHWLQEKHVELKTISETGAFLGCQNIVGPNDPALPQSVTFILPGELGLLVVPFEVIYIRWHAKDNKPTGYAVKFKLDELGVVKQVLSSLINYIRNTQIKEVSKRILDEFFGPGKGGPTFENH